MKIENVLGSSKKMKNQAKVLISGLMITLTLTGCSMIDIKYKNDNNDGFYYGIQENEYLSILEERKIVDEEIDKIVAALDLDYSNTSYVQLINCCKVQKYIVQNTKSFDISVTNRELDILYDGLIKGECNSVTSAIVFKEILSRVGVEALIVVLEDSNGDYHCSNLVKLDGKYFYFDPYLESYCHYNIYGKYDDSAGVALVGLGEETYCERFGFKPLYICEIYNNDKISKNEIPENVAVDNIPVDIIGGVCKEINDNKNKR